MRARQPSYSYSMSFIDILSQLSGDRLRSSKARGIKFGLPCGKFDFYDAQMRDMLELLTDRNFAEKCVRTFGKVTEKLPQLRAKMHAPTRQVVKGQKKAHDALLHLEDLVAARLIGRHCARRFKQLCSADEGPVSLELLLSDEVQRLVSALQMPCKGLGSI